MTIYLHFGMQKTASTSLQRSFQGKGRWGDYVYLSYGRTHSNDIVRRSKTRDLPAFLAAVDRAFAGPIRESGAEHAIISSENFPFFGEDALLAMLERLGQTGHDLRCVGYIRKPKSFMESIFQERLKKRRMTPKDVPDLYPDYRTKFAKFETARDRLGVAVDYWLFEPETMPHGCVVRDFCARLDIPFDPADVVRHNEGLSLPAIRLLQTYRTFGAERANSIKRKAGNRQLVAALATLGGPKFRLHSETAAPILAAQAEDIAWMEARLGAPLSEDLAAHDAGAIRALEELIDPGAPEIDWLLDRAGVRKAPPEAVPPEAVTEWMLRLRRRLVRQAGMARVA
jgi:hypothetical protein